MAVALKKADQSYDSVVMPTRDSEAVELSVVMPCLNEAETLETCIRKAQRALRDANIVGEIIVADNGSSDGSQEIADRLGARGCRQRPPALERGDRRRGALRDVASPRLAP